MKPDEALNIVKQLKNHYRAFEKLEEVLIIVQQSENIIRGHEKRKDEFAKEIAVLKTELEKQKESLSTFNQKWEETRKSTIKTINEELSSLQESAREETRTIHAQLEALRTSLTDAEKAQSEHLTQLRQEEKQVEKELDEAKKELETFKANMFSRFKAG